MKRIVFIGLICLSQFSFASGSMQPQNHLVFYNQLQVSTHEQDKKLKQFMKINAFDPKKSYAIMQAPSSDVESVIGKFTSVEYNPEKIKNASPEDDYASPTAYINTWNATRPAVQTAIKNKFTPAKKLENVRLHAVIETILESKGLFCLWHQYNKNYLDFTTKNSSIEANNAIKEGLYTTITPEYADTYTDMRNKADATCYQAYPTWQNFSIAKLGIDGKQLMFGTGFTAASVALARAASNTENQISGASLWVLTGMTALIAFDKICTIRDTTNSKFDVPAEFDVPEESFVSASHEVRAKS